PVLVEAVEDHVHVGDTALLEKLEARDKLLVEGHDFAVQQQRARGQSLNRGGDVGEAAGAVLGVSREEGYLPAFFVREDPITVVLLLIDPAGMVKRLRDQRRQHRLDAKRHAILHWKKVVGGRW